MIYLTGWFFTSFSMRILLPTSFFPRVSFFIHLVHSESAVIEQMETYPKQTYRNRCEILTSAGILNLVVPVVKSNGNYTMTKDVKICYREPWQHHHWKSILSAYRSSPYFNYYADLIQPFFEVKETLLINLNQNILSSLIQIIGINKPISLSEEYIKHPEDQIDLRSEFKPTKKQQRLSLQEYPQVFSHKYGFVEDLSILDLLFNLGPESGNYLNRPLIAARSQ